ncbi:NUDIX hydrolase [Pontibacter sp. 13R65]|uniref:NUDIX hydrolase n=1 Tax=Pontibacter sp. 13R65 TaxID=3127458 RepID=UPI00301BA27F
MAKKVPTQQLNLFPAGPKLPTHEQVSAGGVAYRTTNAGTEVALISVGSGKRWQLPKGLVDSRETPEATAVREVQEEAGIATKLIQKIHTIEYWYVGSKGGKKVRFHKFVHFFLLQYLSGKTEDHDWEVNEARWVPLDQAKTMLAFRSERDVLQKAAILLKQQ